MYLLWPNKDGSGVPEIAGKGPGKFNYTSETKKNRRLKKALDEKSLLSSSSAIAVVQDPVAIDKKV